MTGLDFIITAATFSLLGYGLAYLTLSADHNANRSPRNPMDMK